jgi:hypothetical protein
MAGKYKWAGYQDGGILKMARKQKRGNVKMAKITNVGEKMVLKHKKCGTRRVR